MINIADIELSKLETLAREVTSVAGELLLDKWLQPRQVSIKGYRDVVTDADYAAQALITAKILAQYPDHGFLTEEDDPSLPEDGPIIWIIDPVDGTTNYSRHIPAFCVSVAAVEIFSPKSLSKSISNNEQANHRVLAAAIFDPFRNELFSASLGRGCTLNSRAMQVSPTVTMESAVIGLDWSRDHQRRQQMLDAVGRLVHQVQSVRVIGSAALALAWVAAGRLDGYCNLALSSWDVAAAELLISEAGGQVSDIAGGTWQLGQNGCLASNHHLHQEILTLTQFQLL
jgi:myo-inositol-1(or 4)-monophosphatase